MKALKLPEGVYRRLLAEAEKKAPLEACGLLAGEGAAVREFYPMTNVDASAEHFSMDPEEQFTVLRKIRDQGWEITGIWHSHPQTPARMSEEDLKLALMPGVSYVILSLAPGQHGEIKAFRKEANESFAEQGIEIS